MKNIKILVLLVLFIATINVASAKVYLFNISADPNIFPFPVGHSDSFILITGEEWSARVESVDSNSMVMVITTPPLLEETSYTPPMFRLTFNLIFGEDQVGPAYTNIRLADGYKNIIFGNHYIVSEGAILLESSYIRSYYSNDPFIPNEPNEIRVVYYFYKINNAPVLLSW